MNYFSLTLILTEYLTLEFGLSDLRAGLVYGIFGSLASAYAFPAGVMSDCLGVRWSLFIAGVLNGSGRLVLALTVRRRTAEAMLFTLLPLANGIDWGILSTGVRRYAPQRSRAVAFAVLASFLNLGQLAAGVARDAFLLPGGEAAAQARGVRAEGSHPETLTLRISGYRALLLFGAAVSALELGLSGFASPGVAPVAAGEAPRARLRLPAKALIAQTLRDAAFWRFALLLLLCSLVRMVLQYVAAALPKYMTRAIGPNVPVGALVAIQPALCVFLVPLVTALAAHRAPLPMVTAGAAVSVVALLWLVADTAIWAVVLFMVTLAVGESMWSPRLFEYTAAVSPAGASCTWAAMGALPLFLAKLPTGLLSGELLERFVPAEGHRRPRLMWLVVFGVSAAGPVAMLLLRRVIRGPRREATPSDAAKDAAAPAEAPQPGAMGLSGEPVELAGAFLQGDFGDVSDSLLRPQTTADPGNPFAIAREMR